MYGLVTIPELSTGENYMYTFNNLLSRCFCFCFVFCRHAVNATVHHITKIWLHGRLELPGSL